MKNPIDIRERILAAATELIHEGSGDVAAITTRAIARRAGVGTGLVNYHFQTKDHLLTLCVQREIHQVVWGFAPEAHPDWSDARRLTDWAASVFEFLFANPSISRISILGDLSAFAEDCNTVHTQRGLELAMTGGTPEGARGLLAFALVAAMQSAFLGGKAGAARAGGDFSTAEGRRVWVARMVSLLYGGVQAAAPEN